MKFPPQAQEEVRGFPFSISFICATTISIAFWLYPPSGIIIYQQIVLWVQQTPGALVGLFLHIALSLTPLFCPVPEYLSKYLYIHKFPQLRIIKNKNPFQYNKSLA